MILSLLSLVLGTEQAVVVLFVIGFFLSRAWYRILIAWLHQPGILQAKDVDVTSSDDEPEAITARSCTILTDGVAIGLACTLPTDLCGRIAIYCGFQGVGALGACCKTIRLQLWESKEVWQALATAAQLSNINDYANACASSICSGREAREAFRRAAFRTNLAHLRSLAAVGRPRAILEEAAHVASGLLPGDLPASALSDFIKIAARALGAHDPESSEAISAAECLLIRARRYMELFTEEQLENLEYAFKSVHQLHSLMLSSMKDSYQEVLEQSFWSADSVLADDQEFREFLALGGNDVVCDSRLS